MFFEQLFLVFLGLCFGVTVAAGVFAFITMLGVVPRLAHRTGTASHLYGYENAIIAGGTFGNVLILFVDHFPVTILGLGVFGVFAGIFVGCLAMALAESLRVIPVFVRRVSIQEGFPILIIAIALGKMLGTLFQYFVR